MTCYRRPRPIALLLAAAILGLTCVATRAESPEAERADRDERERVVLLPQTLERVWYRDRKKLTGDLLLTAEGLEINSRKKSASIPLDSIRVVSVGKMRGDVDTDWVVLSLESTGARKLVGLRDGKKFGFGQGTARIHDKLRRMMRQLGAAQYDMPEGYVAFDDLDATFTLGHPAGWSVSHPSLVEHDERTILGTMIVSSGSPGPGTTPVPEFFVHRRLAVRGMDCGGFSDGAREQILSWAGETELLGKDAPASADVRFEDVLIDGCAGLSISTAGAGDRPVELRAVSDGRIAYLFGVRTLAAHHETSREILARSLSTFRFAVGL